MWPGHQAIAGSLMPPSKVVCLPHRKGPLLPPRDRKAALNPTKYQHFKRTLSSRLVLNEFSFLHGCFFKQHDQSWVFCHYFLVCCVVFWGCFFSISICDEILGVSFQHREKVTVKHTLLSTTKLKTNPEQTGNTPLVFSFPLGVLTAVCNQNWHFQAEIAFFHNDFQF